jgi:signal transduction histidine kinase
LFRDSDLIDRFQELMSRIEVRKSRSLRISHWALAGLMVAMFAVNTIIFPQITIAKSISVLCILIFLAAGYLAIRPQYYFACALAIVVVPTVGLIASVTTDGGVFSFMTPLIVLAPIATAMFLSVRSAAICCAFVILILLGLIGMDQFGLVANPESDRATDVWYSFTMLCFATIVATFAAIFTAGARERVTDDLVASYRTMSTAELEAVRLREIADLQKQNAERASEAKTDFLASMSHELRTPLNGVLGMTQLLDVTELDEKQVRYVRAIKSSGDLLLGMINSLLNVSKIEAGRMDIDVVEFDPKQLLSSVTESVFSLAQQKELALKIEIDGKVPSRLVADRRLLTSVLINLVGNALKFTNEGYVRISLQMDDQNQIRFEVSDSGIGISPEHQTQIFQRFQQTDTPETLMREGTGLGLSICGDLVELMGNEIGVVSELGKGSTFWFTVPAASLI